MAGLTITGLEDDLIERWAQLSIERQKKIENDLRAMLRRAVPTPRSRSEVVRRAREIAAMTPRNVPQTDSVLLLREDRDR